MSRIIIENWHYSAKGDEYYNVIPDGCRDILFWQQSGKAAKFFITSLDETSYQTIIKKGDFLCGFRLVPGVRISEQLLLKSLKGLSYNRPNKIIDRIENYTEFSENVKQALDCLATNANSVNEAAKKLGVSCKSLQRLISKNTGHKPIFWLSLARARKAARLVQTSSNLAQTALECGFCDQSHMNREFRRWFNVTPAKIHKHKDILHQLNNRAYH